MDVCTHTDTTTSISPIVRDARQFDSVTERVLPKRGYSIFSRYCTATGSVSDVCRVRAFNHPTAAYYYNVPIVPTLIK